MGRFYPQSKMFHSVYVNLELLFVYFLPEYGIPLSDGGDTPPCAICALFVCTHAVCGGRDKGAFISHPPPRNTEWLRQGPHLLFLFLLSPLPPSTSFARKMIGIALCVVGVAERMGGRGGGWGKEGWWGGVTHAPTKHSGSPLA